jgi:hypothetical protein
MVDDKKALSGIIQQNFLAFEYLLDTEATFLSEVSLMS